MKKHKNLQLQGLLLIIKKILLLLSTRTYVCFVKKRLKVKFVWTFALVSSSHCKNKMRLKDKKLLIFSTINCFLFVIFFLKSGGYSLTESSSVETSINIVNTTPAPIIVKTTKEVIPAFTGDVIANDLYQKYLGKIFLILNVRFITYFTFQNS